MRGSKGNESIAKWHVMNLQQLGEFGFIDRIKTNSIFRPQGVIKGIDDDCAVFEIDDAEHYGLLTIDALVEGVHFIRDLISPADLGYKSLAVNLSDIAAMGGEPLDAYVSLAIPPTLSVEYLDKFYAGLYDLAGRYGVNVLGGDTTRSKGDFFIAIALRGRVKKNDVCYRHGAKPGDLIFVTGTLGDSAGGLEVLLNTLELEEPYRSHLVSAHNRPKAFVVEGPFLASCGGVTSMIDVSDGIGSDLFHICRQSQVGAEFRQQSIPISEALQHLGQRHARNTLDLALNGGEDYRLLFTATAERAQAIEEGYRNRFGQSLFLVGKITDSGQVVLISDEEQEKILQQGGWDHFSPKTAF